MRNCARILMAGLLLAAWLTGPSLSQSQKANRLDPRAEPVLRSLQDRQQGFENLRSVFAEELLDSAKQQTAPDGIGETDDHRRANEAAFIRQNLHTFGRLRRPQLQTMRRSRSRGQDVHFEWSEAAAKVDPLDYNRRVQNNLRMLLEDQRNGLRIVGGERVRKGDGFESTVGWRRYFNGEAVGGYCSGVLIQPDTVVTAAHCVCDFQLDQFPETLGQYWIVFGEQIPQYEAALPSSVRRIAPDGIVLRMPGFCDHQRAKNTHWHGRDIALLKLQEPASAKYPPAQIADAHLYLSTANYALTISGFGNTQRQDYDFKNPDKFFAAVPFASKLCEPGDPVTLYSNCVEGLEMVLAGWLKDTCEGDSGGPAYLHDHGRYLAAGITSRGIQQGCGMGGIYTILSPAVMAWVDKVTSYKPETSAEVTQ